MTKPQAKPAASPPAKPMAQPKGTKPAGSGQLKGAAGGPGQPKSTISPAGAQDEHQVKFNTVQEKWQRVSNQLSFSDVYDRLEKTGSKVQGLDQRIAALRSRGYHYGSSWEARATTLKERWPGQQQQALSLLDQERANFNLTAQQTNNMLTRAATVPTALLALENQLNSLEQGVSAAEQRISSTFNQTLQETRLLEQELAQAEFLLDSLDSASFNLYPDEAGVAVCKAKWVSDREEPSGLLFLTNARLLFEQREEKATKKVLFITTEKQLVQELLWHAPVGTVEEMNAEAQRRLLARNKELLTLYFSQRSRESPNEATLQLFGTDNHTWVGLIRRVREGRIDAELVDMGGQEVTVLPEPKSIPTQCPNCGAQLPEVFRGMRTVPCDYCGTSVPIEY